MDCMEQTQTVVAVLTSGEMYSAPQRAQPGLRPEPKQLQTTKYMAQPLAATNTLITTRSIMTLLYSRLILQCLGLRDLRALRGENPIHAKGMY